jgi:hypothetical protein
MHLNEWLDKAVETMLAFEINPLDPTRQTAFDSQDLCSFSRLRASEHETEAQTQASDKRKAPARSSIRKSQRVSFLN